MTRISALGMMICVMLAAAAMGAVPDKATIDRDLAGPYATKQAHPDLSHLGPLSSELEPIILKQAKYQLSLLHPWKEDSSALLLTSGDHLEAGIRPNTHTVYGLAVIARCIDPNRAKFPEGLSPEIARDKAIAMLRFALYTHGAGGKVCTDGKPWNSQWQSAYWAANAAEAAWLLWDDLDPEMKWLAARMICDEADRFVDRPLDHQVVSDTKAEENAWNSQPAALAFNMFPNHPRHKAWGETAIKWQVSAFMTSEDAKRTDKVDGRPLNEWSAFPNIYDDYTLENHDRVHPDYMTTISINLFQTMFYDWAGNRAPESVAFNAKKIYASLKWMTFPDGGWLYPNGQDWQLHRCADWVDAHIAMAVLFNDPQAARMARLCIETARKMINRTETGGLYAPGETNFPSSQALVLKWTSHAYLLMGAHGEGPKPEPAEQMWRDFSGKRVFEFGKFAVARTDHSVATFSWGRQVMGMVQPLRKDLLCTPNDHGLIGYVSVAGVKDVPAVKTVNAKALPEGLEVCGILDRGKGAVEQRFAFVSLADGRTIYIDSCKVVGKTPTKVELGTLGVLNEKGWVYGDGRRMLTYEGGRSLFQAWRTDTDAAAETTSKWYNLDGMGIVMLSSSGKQIYIPTPTKSPGRLEQLFHLNHPTSPSELKPTVAVFYPGQMVDQTPIIAPKVTMESADDRHFTITLEDGKKVSTDLDQLTIKVQ